MNKYLKKYNEITERVGGYMELAKCLIADEFDCYFGGYYDENYLLYKIFVFQCSKIHQKKYEKKLWVFPVVLSGDMRIMAE